MSARTAVLLLWIVALAPTFVAGQASGSEHLAPMARDADPSLEIAVIKPSDPDDRQQGFRVRGRRISIEANTLTSILCFAYSIQKSQIANAPSWFSEERWDIDGVPDAEGVPNWKQYRRMLQKLLAGRVGVEMHEGKRELSVYTLTVAKGGPKLEKSKSAPDALSDSTGHGKGSEQVMRFTNISMADLAEFFQLMADKPVLDQTNLEGRFDFTLEWTPDVMRSTEPNQAPGLFTAVQEQLGLKLTPTRAPATVFVVDAATKPTQN